MSDPHPSLDRETKRRLAVIRHVEEVSGNVALSCRYFGISRQAYYNSDRHYQADGVDGLRTGSKRPKSSPRATHVEIIGKIIYLRQNYHFGPAKIAVYLKRYHDVTINNSGVWRIPHRTQPKPDPLISGAPTSNGPSTGRRHLPRSDGGNLCRCDGR